MSAIQYIPISSSITDSIQQFPVIPVGKCWIENVAANRSFIFFVLWTQLYGWGHKICTPAQQKIMYTGDVQSDQQKVLII